MTILAVSLPGKKLYARTGSVAWQEFSPQPPWSTSPGTSALPIVAGLPNGGIICAGTQIGSQEYYHFNPNLNAWTTYAAPSPYGGSPVSIWVVSSTSVYVSYGSGYIDRWNGTAWSRFATGLASAGSLWGTSDSDLWWVGGSGGAEVVYRYNGSSWTNLYATITAAVGACGVPVAVWGQGGKVYVSTLGIGYPPVPGLLTYNGSSWSLVTGPTWLNAGDLWGDGTRLWCLCYYPSSSQLCYELTSGAFVSVKDFGTVYKSDGRCFWGTSRDSTLITVGYTGSGTPNIWESEDSGSSWTEKTPWLDPSNRLSSLGDYSVPSSFRQLHRDPHNDGLGLVLPERSLSIAGVTYPTLSGGFRGVTPTFNNVPLANLQWPNPALWYWRHSDIMPTPAQPALYRIAIVTYQASEFTNGRRGLWVGTEDRLNGYLVEMSMTSGTGMPHIYVTRVVSGVLTQLYDVSATGAWGEYVFCLYVNTDSVSHDVASTDGVGFVQAGHVAAWMGTRNPRALALKLDEAAPSSFISDFSNLVSGGFYRSLTAVGNRNNNEWMGIVYPEGLPTRPVAPGTPPEDRTVEQLTSTRLLDTFDSSVHEHSELHDGATLTEVTNQQQLSYPIAIARSNLSWLTTSIVYEHIADRCDATGGLLRLACDFSSRPNADDSAHVWFLTNGSDRQNGYFVALRRGTGATDLHFEAYRVVAGVPTRIGEVVLPFTNFGVYELIIWYNYTPVTRYSQNGFLALAPREIGFTFRAESASAYAYERDRVICKEDSSSLLTSWPTMRVGYGPVSMASGANINPSILVPQIWLAQDTASMILEGNVSDSVSVSDLVSTTIYRSFQFSHGENATASDQTQPYSVQDFIGSGLIAKRKFEPLVDPLIIRATITAQGRKVLDRSAREGLSVSPVRFTLGTGFENPRWGNEEAAAQDATDLASTVLFEGSVWTGELTLESANPKTLVIRCSGPASAQGVTEILVYAQIRHCLTEDNFREIPFASATVPIWCSTPGQVFVARIVIPLG